MKKIENFELALNYSEDKNKLKNLIDSIEIFYSIKYPLYNKENKLLKLPIEIVIKKNKTEINYTFFDSHIKSLNYFNSYFELCKILDKSEYNKSILRDLGIRDNSINDFYKYEILYKRKVINNKSEHLKNLSYSILCDVSVNLSTPLFFKDFCDEFGYNTDSIKYKKLFENCVDHKRELLKIFKEDDINFLPR